MLKKLIKEADLEGANDQMKKFLSLLGSYEKEVLHNSGSLNKLTEDLGKGTINEERAQMFRLRVQASMIDLCMRMEDQIGSFFPKDNLLEDGQEFTTIQRLNQKLKDRYVVTRELFVGSRAAFYVGKEIGVERKVVFRVVKNQKLKKRLTDQEESKDLEVLLNLKHRNIVRIFGNDMSSSLKYQILEYINSISLDHLIEKSIPFTLNTSLSLITQLVDALYYLHINGVKHGNIKPDKVLIDNELKPVISVFELGNEGEIKYNSVFSIEKLLYTAPELLSGRIEAPDSLSDQFSMGLLAFEILTGKPLFDFNPPNKYNKSIQQIFENRQQFFKSKKFRSTLFNGLKIPRKLIVILTRMLEEKPEDRFESVAEVRRALESIDLETDQKIEILTSSYMRCAIKNPDFTADFYERLFTETPEGAKIKERFFAFEQSSQNEIAKKSKQLKVRVGRRHKMLRLAIDLLIWSHKDPTIIENIKQMKSHQGIGIEDYKLFIRTLINTIKENDYLWNAYNKEEEAYLVRESWETLLDHCLAKLNT